jgi:hypothetical protein
MEFPIVMLLPVYGRVVGKKLWFILPQMDSK